MKPVISGFSFVEILLTISILIVLSVVAVTWYSHIQEKSINTNVSSSIQSLDSGLSMYQEDKKLFPLPDGNLKYFSSGWTYVHPWFDQNIFGVSGFITQETLHAEYLPKLPLDPRSNQYYAYGTTNNQKYFQVAWIIMHNDDPFTLVKWNYIDLKSTELTNIVKEYAGPEFVYDDSDAYFPYNPEERMLIAHIVSYSGSISINGVPADAPTIQSTKLMEWDHVTISTWGLANIYYSDGSNSELGSTGSYTDFTFANMRYQNQDNLLTQIRIALNFWKIFTRVSKLASSSEFEIYTKDAIASVRGTVFTVIYDGHTTWTVDQGKVEVREDPSVFSDLPPLIESIKSKWIETWIPVVAPVDPVFTEGTKTYIEVKPWESDKSYTLSKWLTVSVWAPLPTVWIAPPPPIIYWQCWSSNSTTTAVAPKAPNLCNSWSATPVTIKLDSFTWSCEGSNWGTTINCSAPRQYTVTFNTNGGSTSSPTTKRVTYNTAIWDLPVSHKTNYTFSWWYTETSWWTQVSTTTPITQDITLFAHWTANTQKVTDCTWTLPNNASWVDQTFTQTWNGTSWSPKSLACTQWTSGEWRFNCNVNYSWNPDTSSCWLIQNWVCWSANNNPRVNAPKTNLCADWSKPNVSITWCWCNYKWTCNWKNGGSPENCSIQVIKKPKSTSPTVSSNTITWKWTYDTTWWTPKHYQWSTDNGVNWIEMWTWTEFIENNLKCNTQYSRLVRACDTTAECTTWTTLTAQTTDCSPKSYNRITTNERTSCIWNCIGTQMKIIKCMENWTIEVSSWCVLASKPTPITQSCVAPNCTGTGCWACPWPHPKYNWDNDSTNECFYDKSKYRNYVYCTHIVNSDWNKVWCALEGQLCDKSTIPNPWSWTYTWPLE